MSKICQLGSQGGAGLEPNMVRPELEEDKLRPESWSLDERLTLGIRKGVLVHQLVYRDCNFWRL